MIVVKYRKRIFIPDYRAMDVPEITKFHRVEFHGGILYGYRSKYSINAISEDEVEEIEDTDSPGAYIDVKESFQRQELAYHLPF